MIFNNSDGTWIACKVLAHCKSLNPPPPRMRSQTPPLLLKKRENCHKIIKLPLLVHKTFGTIHTIQYYCIKYCSPGRRRGYYNGLYRGALPIAKGYLFQASGTWKGRVFIAEVYERDICHFSLLKDENEITDTSYGCDRQETCFSDLFML